MRLRWRAGLVWPRLPWLVPAVLVGASVPFLPAHAQVWRSVWTGSVNASAEVVGMPARIGPVMTTLVVAASPSAFVTRAGPAAATTGPSTAAAPTTTTTTTTTTTSSQASFDVSAVPGPGDGSGAAPAGLPAPATAPVARVDAPPVLEPTVAGEVMRSYVVSANSSPSGSSGVATAGPSPGVSGALRAMVQLRDGTTGQTVLVQQPNGAGDGRMVVTVVFN